LLVGKFSITDAEIVWRGGYDKIDMFIREFGQSLQTIVAAEMESSHERKLTEVVQFVQRKL